MQFLKGKKKNLNTKDNKKYKGILLFNYLIIKQVHKSLACMLIKFPDPTILVSLFTLSLQPLILHHENKKNLKKSTNSWFLKEIQTVKKINSIYTWIIYWRILTTQGIDKTKLKKFLRVNQRGSAWCNVYIYLYISECVFIWIKQSLLDNILKNKQLFYSRQEKLIIKKIIFR